LTATRSDAGGLATLLAVIVDPSIGLVGNFPVFLAVVVAAGGVLARCTPRDHRPPMTSALAVATLAGAVFLFAFARTTNVHHGGTPSLSRYAIWLIPLAIPLLEHANGCGSPRWHRFSWTAAVISAAISVIAFRPAVPQNSHEPTLLATMLWTRVPSWNNPLAEVFSETILHTDDLSAPVATDGCEKVLVGGGSSGVWPAPCYPAPLPLFCTSAAALCYANRVKDGYQFATAPGSRAATVRAGEVWPADTERHVRRLYEAWDWRTLDMSGHDRTMMANAFGVSVTPIGSADRFILILRNPRAGATLRLKAARPMNGVLVDTATGATLATLSCAGPNTACEIALRAASPVLLLAMR
jgi:hypothetical protein